MSGENRTERGRTLHAFYDLAAAPDTFDILVFLTLAELERQDAGCDAFHLFVVPGPNAGFRIDANVDHLARLQYVLRNVLLPSAALVPTCSGVSSFSSREFVEDLLYRERLAGDCCRLTFPAGYSVHLPIRHYQLSMLLDRWQRGAEVPSLQPTQYGLELVDAFLRRKCGPRKVITVTLRESIVQPERNSNLREWGHFVATLDPCEYAVVVLRDLEKIQEPLPSEFAECLLFPEGVVSIELRAALYRRAYLNLCVNNGPAELLRLDRQARYLYFKPLTRGVSCTTVYHHRQYLWLEPGDQLPFATPFQRMVWHDDRVETLTTEFTSMVRLIESDRYNQPASVKMYQEQQRQRWFERYPGGRTDA